MARAGPLSASNNNQLGQAQKKKGDRSMKHSFWRKAARYALLFFISTVFAVASQAQQTLGSINGTVLDASGAAVPDATVTAIDKATNFEAKTKSQGSGFFQIFNLPIGTYVVKVSHEGFESTDLTNVPVQEARATTVNPTLKIGADHGVGYSYRDTAAECDRHDQRLHARQRADRNDAAGDGQLHAGGGSFAGRERRTALEPRFQRRTGQPAHLGQRAARHIEYVSGEWRRLDQPLQRQELQRRLFAALQLQYRQRTHGGRIVFGGHIGLRIERQQPAFASAGVHAGACA